MDILTMIMNSIDVYAVIIAFAMTQFIKMLLPSPPGAGKMDVAPFYFRLLPIAPLVIGILVVLIKDGLISPTMKVDDAIVRGLVSGIGASYLHRTAKVVIFGKNGDKPAEPKPDEAAKGLIDKTLGLLK